MFRATIYNIFSEQCRDTSSDNVRTAHIRPLFGDLCAAYMERAVVAIVPTLGNPAATSSSLYVYVYVIRQRGVLWNLLPRRSCRGQQLVVILSQSIRARYTMSNFERRFERVERFNHGRGYDRVSFL